MTPLVVCWPGSGPLSSARLAQPRSRPSAALTLRRKLDVVAAREPATLPVAMTESGHPKLGKIPMRRPSLHLDHDDVGGCRANVLADVLLGF